MVLESVLSKKRVFPLKCLERKYYVQTGSRPHSRQKHTDTMAVPLERLAPLSSRSKDKLQQCNSLLSFNNENIQKGF